MSIIKIVFSVTLLCTITMQSMFNRRAVLTYYINKNFERQAQQDCDNPPPHSETVSKFKTGAIIMGITVCVCVLRYYLKHAPEIKGTI